MILLDSEFKVRADVLRHLCWIRYSQKIMQLDQLAELLFAELFDAIAKEKPTGRVKF